MMIRVVLCAQVPGDPDILTVRVKQAGSAEPAVAGWVGPTKHGVPAEDIEHAYDHADDHARLIHEQDEGVVVAVVPARDGELIELG